MEIWQGVVLALVGVAAGWMNVMAGGGSLLTVPAMLFLDVPAPVANGTNRIAILAQNATAVTTFFRASYSDFRLSATLALAALPGAVVGAFVGTRLEGEWFDRLLAGVMIAVMALMLRKPGKPAVAVPGPVPRRLLLGHVCMVGAGFWGGFIHVGVGFILMPILHRVLGIDLVRVNMHKVFIVLVYTVASLAIFASRVDLLWMMGLCLAAGNSVGGWLGAKTTVSKGEGTIRVVFNATLAVLIVKLLFFGDPDRAPGSASVSTNEGRVVSLPCVDEGLQSQGARLRESIAPGQEATGKQRVAVSNEQIMQTIPASGRRV